MGGLARRDRRLRIGSHTLASSGSMRQEGLGQSFFGRDLRVCGDAFADQETLSTSPGRYATGLPRKAERTPSLRP